MSPIAYLCSATRCHRLLARPGHCAEHRAKEAQRKRTKLRQQGTDAPHWVKLRRMVKVRDGNQCQVCGTNEDLTVHLDPSLRGNHHAATIDDCTTVCRFHHGQLDQSRSLTVQETARGGRV